LAVKLASASYPFAGFVTAGKFQTVSIWKISAVNVGVGPRPI
jgi:hypothetical protein